MPLTPPPARGGASFFAHRRDPTCDYLLTPQNAAIVIIDFQPVHVSSIASQPKRELVSNITALARIAKLRDADHTLDRPRPLAAIIIGGLAGCVGAIVANFLLSHFRVVLGGWVSYLVAGFIGACILIALARMIRRTA